MPLGCVLRRRDDGIIVTSILTAASAVSAFLFADRIVLNRGLGCQRNRSAGQNWRRPQPPRRLAVFPSRFPVLPQLNSYGVPKTKTSVVDIHATQEHHCSKARLHRLGPHGMRASQGPTTCARANTPTDTVSRHLCCAPRKWHC